MGPLPESSPADAGGVYAGDRLLAWGGTDAPPSLVAAAWVPSQRTGEPVQTSPRTGDDEPSTDPSTREDGDVEPFCAAAQILDQTDGTTDTATAVAAIDELRRTAPAEIRADVDLISDTMIINNFPDATDPSMRKASLEELNAAGARVGHYVDEHCDLDR
jgi:hypothetical protein